MQKFRVEPNTTTTDAKPRQRNLPAYTDGVKEAGRRVEKSIPTVLDKEDVTPRRRRESHRRRSKKPWQVGTSDGAGNCVK